MPERPWHPRDLRAPVPTLEPDDAFLHLLGARAAAGAPDAVASGATIPVRTAASRWQVGLAAASVAIVMIGAAWLTGLRPEGRPDPAPPPASPPTSPTLTPTPTPVHRKPSPPQRAPEPSRSTTTPVEVAARPGPTTAVEGEATRPTRPRGDRDDRGARRYDGRQRGWRDRGWRGGGRGSEERFSWGGHGRGGRNHR